MKKSVNLIIKSKIERPFIQRLKILLPLTASLGLLLFCVVFVVSVVYLNTNLKEYNLLNKDIEALKGEIASQKKAEGIYNISALKLTVLEQIISQQKSFTNVISQINNFKNNNLTISLAKIDTDQKISLSITASSSAVINDFVEKLLISENQKKFSKIFAEGFMKNKKNEYTFIISMLADPTLFK